MNSTHFVDAPIRSGEKLRVFALYTDYPAAAQVNWLRNQLGGFCGVGQGFCFDAWKLDAVIGHGPISETIAGEARESDLLVIATTALDRREPELFQWLNSLDQGHENGVFPKLLIGLLGNQQNRAAELDWMVSGLMGLSRRTKMSFVWQWMGQEAKSDSAWLARSLQEFLREETSDDSVAGGKTHHPLPRADAGGFSVRGSINSGKWSG